MDHDWKIFAQTELQVFQIYLQGTGVLGGVDGGVGLVRFLALSWVGTPGLANHPLGERPPDRALCLLLHQRTESQRCGENVGLRAWVADVPEQKHIHKSSSHQHKRELHNGH